MPAHIEEFLQAAVGARTRIQEVSSAEIAPLVDQGAVLLEVREKDEFDRGHIDRARHYPRCQLESNVAALAPDKQAPCLCGTAAAGAPWRPMRCKRWATYLHVFWIAGGLTDYKKSAR